MIYEIYKIGKLLLESNIPAKKIINSSLDFFWLPKLKFAHSITQI